MNLARLEPFLCHIFDVPPSLLFASTSLVFAKFRVALRDDVVLTTKEEDVFLDVVLEAFLAVDDDVPAAGAMSPRVRVAVDEFRTRLADWRATSQARSSTRGALDSPRAFSSAERAAMESILGEELPVFTGQPSAKALAAMVRALSAPCSEALRNKLCAALARHSDPDLPYLRRRLLAVFGHPLRRPSLGDSVKSHLEASDAQGGELLFLQLDIECWRPVCIFSSVDRARCWSAIVDFANTWLSDSSRFRLDNADMLRVLEWRDDSSERAPSHAPTRSTTAALMAALAPRLDDGTLARLDASLGSTHRPARELQLAVLRAVRRTGDELDDAALELLGPWLAGLPQELVLRRQSPARSVSLDGQEAMTVEAPPSTAVRPVPLQPRATLADLSLPAPPPTAVRPVPLKPQTPMPVAERPRPPLIEMPIAVRPHELLHHRKPLADRAIDFLTRLEDSAYALLAEELLRETAT